MGGIPPYLGSIAYEIVQGEAECCFTLFDCIASA